MQFASCRNVLMFLEEPAVTIVSADDLNCVITMKTVGSSDASVHFYQTVRCYIPEDSNPHFYIASNVCYVGITVW